MANLQIATITRTQDYTQVKHQEDTRAMVQQTVIGHQEEKDLQQRAREVRSGDQAEWQGKKFDAREKGDNEYSGDRNPNRRKKQEPQERVIVKGRQGFDIKI